MKKTKEKSVWSADGLLLGKLEYNKQSYCIDQNGIEEIVYNDYFPSNRFINKKRAKLESDRREVDYIMKKMACESREDNDWRKIKGLEMYYISFNNQEIGFSVESQYYGIEFNRTYFYTQHDAQKCLDFLLNKYGENRLKEIWGIE